MKVKIRQISLATIIRDWQSFWEQINYKKGIIVLKYATGKPF